MSTHTPSLRPNHRTEQVVQFLAELRQSTMEYQTKAAFQQALQTYCDNLRPWLEPRDSPPNPRAIFSLLEDYTVDETGDNVTVVLSLEAEALFRAWLRYNKDLQCGWITHRARVVQLTSWIMVPLPAELRVNDKRGGEPRGAGQRTAFAR
jgi:hypothetical protein